jgi:GntR family transcriptional repressor for pyruvate dehydrogenase complex
MIALELSGVIEIRTGSGIYVTQEIPSLKTRDKGVGPFEILECREMVEVEACGLAATRITDVQIAQLYKAVEEMKVEELSDNPSEQADWKFHCLIAEASQNSAIHSIVNWLWELRNKSDISKTFLATIREGGVHPAIDDHLRVIRALEKRDPVAAKHAMKQHIEWATTATAAHFET